MLKRLKEFGILLSIALISSMSLFADGENKLIKLDYMIKKSNNYDKRVQTAILTKKGHILKESLYDKINDLNYKATNQLSIDEKEIIHLSIEKLAWTLECNRENN